MNTTKQAMVAYHGDHCTDGLASMVIMGHYLEGRDFHVETQAMQYHQPMAFKDLDLLIYVDFCPEFDVLVEDLRYNKTVVVIDHHPRALEMDWDAVPNELKHKLSWYCDEKACGAMLVWKYCYDGKRPPQALSYIDDRDRWIWKYAEESRDFSAGFQVYDAKNKARILWQLFFKAQVQRDELLANVICEGRAINNYQQQVVQKQVRMAQIQLINGYAVVVVNTPELVSETCHALLDLHPYVSYAATFHQMANGHYKYSVRSRSKDTPIHSVVASYGGGGHPCAGGMTVHTTDLFETFSIEQWAALCSPDADCNTYGMDPAKQEM